jgi:hypothetical protein
MIKNIFICFIITLFSFGCDISSSSRIEEEQQEVLLRQAVESVGMPAMKNFREKKLFKEIFEMRDQASLTTYTYIVAEQTGQLVFFCNSVGYGIPYATQFTAPGKISDGGGHVIPQADPNGLYSPSSADGTWILCKDPNGDEVKPVFVEPKIIVSQFDLIKKVIEKPVEKPIE